MDDDNQSIVIGEYGNRCIVQWKISETNGKAVSDDRDQVIQLNLSDKSINVIIEKQTHSLLIADRRN